MSGTTVSKEAKNSHLKDSSLVNPAVVNEDEDEDEVQYITGVKLAVILVAVIIIALLIMLDMSIIATVSRLLWLAHLIMCTDFSKRQSLKSRATSTLLRMLVGTEVLIC